MANQQTKTGAGHDDLSVGRRLYKQDRYAEAIVFLHRAQDVYPGNCKLLWQLAYCYSETGSYAKAALAYEKAIDLQPDDGKLHLYLGCAYAELEQFARAEESFQRAIERGEDSAALRNNLGEAQWKQGRGDDALENLRIACRLDPNDVNSPWKMAEILAKRGEYEAARERLEVALQIQPDNAGVHDWLGYVAAKQNAWERALVHYRRAVALGKDDAALLAQIGHLLHYLGRDNEARTAYRQALRREPGCAPARAGLEIVGLRWLPPPLPALRTAWRNAAALYQTISEERPFEEDEAFQDYVRFARDRCSQWFGPPEYPDRPLRIWEGPFTGASFLRSDRHYLILMDKRLRESELRYVAVGHEIYHCVTMLRRRALRRFVWVDEMLAEMAALRLLREQGRDDLADERIRDGRTREEPLGIAALKRARRSRIRLFTRGDTYPKGFGAGVHRLGPVLETLVGWKQTCRLASCRTWEEWLAPLAPDVRVRVCRLLDLPERLEVSPE